jgi:hypothetical protein
LILCELTSGIKPARICLIETGGKLESHQVMEVNATSYLYFKHGSPINSSINDYRYRWQFVFSPTNVEQLKKLLEQKPVGLALVCGHDTLEAAEIKIAFIPPEKFKDVLDLTIIKQQIIYIHQTNTNRIEVNPGDKGFQVAQNALQKWNP